MNYTVNRELLNAQKELISHAFSQAQAYTNVILVAGYAGFFAIWSFLKPELTKPQLVWSALLVTLSLTAFILWEVYQSFYRSRSLLGLAKTVQDPSRFQELLAEHRVAEHDRLIALKRVWVVAFGFTVTTGFGAVLVLLWAFVRSLWSAYVV